MSIMLTVVLTVPSYYSAAVSSLMAIDSALYPTSRSGVCRPY